MSHQSNATDVERNAVDKEKGSPDKSESLKRSASEVSLVHCITVLYSSKCHFSAVSPNYLFKMYQIFS